MIKVKEEDIGTALQGFEAFAKNQSKVRTSSSKPEQVSNLSQDGKPYILSMEAGEARGSVRDQGYTFVTKSVFESMSDMKFYEDECPAHREYKVFLKEKAPVSGLMSLNFEPGVSFSL
jgi:hypothetical protein